MIINIDLFFQKWRKVGMWFLNNIKVYAFVGPSGTGKSYRAQFVAGENDATFL